MRIRSALVASVLSMTPALACAQIRASEHGTVTQRVSGTTIAVEYDRPVARGRTLFGEGGVVRWGDKWTPGANWATTIDVDTDVRVDGQPLPKGKYSIWLVPAAAPAPWTMIFSRAARRFHTRPPGPEDDQLRIAVKPEQGMHMEALTWYFPIVTPDGTTLRMHWGTTYVPVQIGVELPRMVSLPADERPAYVGTYHLHVTPTGGRASYDTDVTIREVNDALKVVARPIDVFGNEVELVPVGDRRFHITYPASGKFRGQFYTEPGMIFVFDLSGGHAQGVQLIGYDNSVIGRGALAK
jgi:hypothetical protein